MSSDVGGLTLREMVGQVAGEIKYIHHVDGKEYGGDKVMVRSVEGQGDGKECGGDKVMVRSVEGTR